MKVAIVIVNYKSADLAVECLRSLEPEIAKLPGAKVVVVENASADGSAQRLATAIDEFGWNAWAKLLPLRNNMGYAAGNNAAIRFVMGAATPPEFVLLLNPDTLVRTDGVMELLAFMEKNPKVGIAGSRLEHIDGTPQQSAFRFPSVWTELEQASRLGVVSKVLKNRLAAPPVRDDAHETDWVAGASMMIRKAVIDQIGLLDERYFLYYEEVDFCHTAKRAGWPCWYVPASRVVHLVGQSSGVKGGSGGPSRKPRYWFESRRMYFVRNRGMLHAMAADWAFSAGFALWRIRRPLQRKPDMDPPHLLWDLFRHSPLWMRDRRQRA